MVQNLRANLTLGWDEQMSAPIKQIAEMEKEVRDFLFRDA